MGRLSFIQPFVKELFFLHTFYFWNAQFKLCSYLRKKSKVSKVSILGLKLPTDPRWVNLAAISLQDILTDHAYCEQKAASSAISLIQRNPERTKLVEALAPIVTEEWGHFRQVLAELKKRGLALGKQRKDDYVNALLNNRKKGGQEEQFAQVFARSR